MRETQRTRVSFDNKKGKGWGETTIEEIMMQSPGGGGSLLVDGGERGKRKDGDGLMMDGRKGRTITAGLYGEYGKVSNLRGGCTNLAQAG